MLKSEAIDDTLLIADTLRLFHPYESNCDASFTFTLYTALLSIYKFNYCGHFRWQIKAIYSELKISPVKIHSIIWKQKVTKSFKSGNYSNLTIQRLYTDI